MTKDLKYLYFNSCHALFIDRSLTTSELYWDLDNYQYQNKTTVFSYSYRILLLGYSTLSNYRNSPKYLSYQP
jgi:hypothetical protein